MAGAQGGSGKLLTSNTPQTTQTFQTGLHPRGSDGRFITLGGRVQVDGPNGPVAEGVVKGVQTNAAGQSIATVTLNNGQQRQINVSGLSQAPTVKAELDSAGAIPNTAPAARAQAIKDANAGLPPRKGASALGTKASPEAVAAYNAAYARQAKIAAAVNALNAKKGVVSGPNSAQIAKYVGKNISILTNDGTPAMSGTVLSVSGSTYVLKTRFGNVTVDVSNTRKLTPSASASATGSKAAASKAASKAKALARGSKYKNIRSQQTNSLSKFTKKK